MGKKKRQINGDEYARDYTELGSFSITKINYFLQQQHKPESDCLIKASRETPLKSNGCQFQSGTMEFKHFLN